MCSLPLLLFIGLKLVLLFVPVYPFAVCNLSFWEKIVCVCVPTLLYPIFKNSCNAIFISLFHIGAIPVEYGVVDLLFGWFNWSGKHSSDIWNIVPLCLMWTIWRERNRRTFEDVASSKDQVRVAFDSSLFEWSRARCLTSSTSVSHFITSLS